MPGTTGTRCAVARTDKVPTITDHIKMKKRKTIRLFLIIIIAVNNNNTIVMSDLWRGMVEKAQL